MSARNPTKGPPGGRASKNAADGATAGKTDAGYRVGPGRPPREYQFKPGQSGNPKGAKKKPKSIVPDFKAMLERALNAKITVKDGGRERTTTKLAVGLEQLANQYARGDRHARRDVFTLAKMFGVNLLAGSDDVNADSAGSDGTISARDKSLLDIFARRYVRQLDDDHASEGGATAARGQDVEASKPAIAKKDAQ